MSVLVHFFSFLLASPIEFSFLIASCDSFFSPSQPNWLSHTASSRRTSRNSRTLCSTSPSNMSSRMTCLRPSTNFSLPRNHQVKHNFEPKPHNQAISVNSFIVVIFYFILFYFIYYYFVRIQARRGYFQPANAPTRDWGDRLEVCCCVRGQEPASPACCRSCGLLGQPSRDHWKNQNPACGWRYSEWASRLDLKEEEIGKGWNYAPPVEAMLEAAFNSLPSCLLSVW